MAIKNEPLIIECNISGQQIYNTPFEENYSKSIAIFEE